MSKFEKEFKNIENEGSSKLREKVEDLTSKMAMEPVFKMDKDDLKIYARCNSMLFDFSGYTKFNYALKAIDACEKYLALDIADEEMQTAYINMLENVGNTEGAFNCIKDWLNNAVTKDTARAFLCRGISGYSEYMTTEEREKFGDLYSAYAV